MTGRPAISGSIVLAGGTVGGAGTRAALEAATLALAGRDATVIAPMAWPVPDSSVRVVHRRWIPSIVAEFFGLDRADHYIGFADRLPIIGRAGRRSQVMVIQNLFLYIEGSDYEDANRAKIAALRWWARRSVGRADSIVVSSEGSANALIASTDADPSRIEVRPIPVPAPATTKEEHAQKLQTVLLVGDLYRHKRSDLAVDAVAAFASTTGRPCRVVHLGGDLEPEAVASFGAATERARALDVTVERRGSVGREDVLSAMVEADVMVMLSTTETQGIPLREALVVGLPVLCEATDVFVEQGGDAAEFVSADGPDRAANVSAVVDGLLRLDDVELRRRRSRDGRRLVDAGSGWWLLAESPLAEG